MAGHQLIHLLDFEARGDFKENLLRFSALESSVWTALYYTQPNASGICECFNVQWGDTEVGPIIKYETAIALARARLSSDPKLRFLVRLHPMSKRDLGY